MRLNKFLANAGIASRRNCDKIIEEGKVKVNGVVVKELGTVVDELKDKVEYDGKVIKHNNQYVYYKLNKPKGYMCTANDKQGRKTIYELFTDLPPDVRLFSAGRLDYDTEGLIILTNDGDFAQKLIHPASSIEKEYYCTVEGPMKESELAVLRAGVVIDVVRMPKAKVSVIEVRKMNTGIVLETRISVTINQGLNRQIRRTLEAVNKHIKLLKRVRIGDITLGGLRRGKYKELTQEEIDCIGFY